MSRLTVGSLFGAVALWGKALTFLYSAKGGQVSVSTGGKLPKARDGCGLFLDLLQAGIEGAELA